MPGALSPVHRGIVLVPVKAFDHAKARLSSELDPTTRTVLAREMATHVVRVQHGVDVAICCDDTAVAAWADSVGAQVVWCPGTDLNGAVRHGVDAARAAGYEAFAVAHSDLPLAVSLDRFLDWPGITIVPDRHRSGTNVIAMATSVDFEFGYGQGSFMRHVCEAVRHRRGLRIVHDGALGWDVDHPVDLVHPDSALLAEVLRTKAAHDRS